MIPRGPISLWWYSPRRLWRKSRDSPDWHSLENPNSSCQAVLTRSQVVASVFLSRVHCSCVSWTHPCSLWALRIKYKLCLKCEPTGNSQTSTLGQILLLPQAEGSWWPKGSPGLSFFLWFGIPNCPWHSRCLTTKRKQAYKSSCQTLDHDHNGCYWKQCQLSLDLLRRPPVKQFLCYPPIQTLPKPPREVRKGSFMPDEETKPWLLQHICTCQGSSWRFAYISIMEGSSTA